MLREIDFSIESIQHVIERHSDTSWKMDGVTGVYVLGIVLKGNASYTIDGYTCTAREGGLLLIPPGAHRRASSSAVDPWHFITIGCQLRFFTPDAKAAFEALPLYFQQIPETIRVKAKALATSWSDQSCGRPLLAKGLLYELFHELITFWDQKQSDPAHYDRIQYALTYIQQHYASPIRQEELARLCGYSASHFRRCFSSCTGMSFRDYLLRYRISVAKNLLLSGTCTVSEAAALTGFSDVFHFSRMFKKVTGYPPSHDKP